MASHFCQFLCTIMNNKIRSNFINLLIETFNYKSYLEIGVYDSRFNFELINVELRHGVDPNGVGIVTHKMTSDDFFLHNSNKYDIIFVDGLHTEAQVTKDINNALSCLNSDGLVVVHDCNVPEDHLQDPRFYGTVWKAWVKLMQILPPDIEMFVVDIDTGIGIIKETNNGTRLARIPDNQLTFENLQLNRDKWLNIKTYEDVTSGFLQRKQNVCVTAITGGYDNIISNSAADHNTKFICFTDNLKLTSDFWEIRPACTEFNDLWDANVRNAKRHKVMIHEYVDCEYSLWIDGFIKLTKPLSYIISKYADRDHDIWMFKHPTRNCAYEEMEVCCAVGLDKEDIVRKQQVQYEADKFPHNYGLHAGGMILRRHTNKIQEFNTIWWDEICKYSKRDQLSLDYSAWKAGIKIGLIDEVWRHSSFCEIGLHAAPFNHPKEFISKET
jgi:hypothetical protein